MQRFSLRFLFLAALYVSTSSNATCAESEILLAPIVPENPTPHIALILPLKSKSPALVHYAEMVKQGFIAAGGIQQGIPIRIYASADEAKEVVTLYRQAAVNGAMAVAGPLTRDGVSALASFSNLSAPVLALNSADQLPESNKLYFFGLPAELEARQVAANAIHAELKFATIISSGTAVSKRLAAAFADEWRNQGGKVTAEVVFKDDFDAIAKLPVAPWPNGKAPKPVYPISPTTGKPIIPDRPMPPPIAPGNMVFLAIDHDKARLIKPYINPSLPVYATSQLFGGNSNKLANYDLNDIQFVDMPWMLQPDHPAVMIYPRSAASTDANLERLYALGIDAYRLLYLLLSNRLSASLPLDGVTGKVNLYNQQFVREPLAAFFKHGLGFTHETLAAFNAAKAVAKAAELQAETEDKPTSPVK